MAVRSRQVSVVECDQDGCGRESELFDYGHIDFPKLYRDGWRSGLDLITPGRYSCLCPDHAGVKVQP